MSGTAPTPTISLRERANNYDEGQEKLRRWLVLSVLLHGLFILGLFLTPYWPGRKIVPPPVYTVDLVGGERIGGNNLATEFVLKSSLKKIAAASTPPPSSPKPKIEAKSEPPSPPPVIKKQAKREVVEQPAKTLKKTVEKKAPSAENIAAKSLAKKETPKKEMAVVANKETSKQTKSDEESLERVRERLIQSAVERVKNRTEAPQKSSKGEVLSAGTGEGLGSASLGPGGPGGGGVAKGIEFIGYQNQMLSTIKANWAWVGQNNNLRVVVQFYIRENGDITKLKIVQPSGDPSYDESVLRAVTKSSPLPPPPESYRKDFSEIKITFRPRDLGA